MVRKTKRLLLLVVSCSAAGVVLGGTASWAESNQCMQASNITSDCLTQSPVTKTLQGMSTGLINKKFYQGSCTNHLSKLLQAFSVE